MKLKLLFVLLVFQVGLAQQRTCGTQVLMEQIMSNPTQRQAYLEQQEKFEVELQRLESNSLRNTNAVIRIPVAVHYPTAGAVTDAVKTCLRRLAQKQIDILNADYNAVNTDISTWNNNDSAFFPGISTGNLNVQFVIATQNHPAESGLLDGELAVTFGTAFIGSGVLNCASCNEDLTWAGYMNIVVTNISGGILGFSPLGGTPGTGKTVVIDNNSFGAALSPSPASCSGFAPSAPYNKGRTLTHELGHFFNLAHTFQACDGTNCTNTGDKVCDTPSANTATYDCPAVGTVTGCVDTQLTMNYMDYTNDACMYMFTAGQATRMLAWYNFIRTQLTTTALSNETFLENQFSIYPNPNKGSFTIEFKELANSFSVEVYDVTGKTIFENNYDQSANPSQMINLDNVNRGIYFINVKCDKGLVTKKLVIE
jgi:hypothetical protein